MNRSIAGVGVAVILLGFGLVAFPVVVTGQERLDPEQIAGFLVAPVGLVVVLIAAISVDPRRTTIVGTFGNPDETPSLARPSRRAAPRPAFTPSDPVYCRYCRAVITSDLSACPRCARARECRSCGRPLGQVLGRPTCPTCAQAEAFCSCARLAHPGGSGRPGRAVVR